VTDKICAVYARVSTDMQAESLENQVDYAMEYIRRLGVGFILGEACVYKDFDQSGYYTRFLDRPAIQMALEDAKERKYDVIVFKEISRISRDQAEHVEIVTRFTQHGIRLIAINDNVDSDRPETLDLLGIHSVTAEMESRRISSRVSSARRSKARRGAWVGEPPIGYKVDAETQKLTTDDRYAEIPQLIFTLYAAGLGTFRIAEQLNSMNLLSKNDKLWTRSTVNHVLRNPAYVGDLIFGKTRNTLVRRFDDNQYTKSMGRKRMAEQDWIVIRDSHPAIIDRAVFEQVQSILASRRTQNPRRSRHPLTGILVCAQCGSGMICQRRTHGEREYRYYCCSMSFKYGRKFCNQRNLNAIDVETVVLDYLLDQLNKFEDLPIVVDRDDKSLRKQRRRKEEDLHKANEALKRVFAAELSGQQLRDIVTHWRDEIVRLELGLAELRELEKADEARQSRMAKVEDYINSLKELGNENLEKRRILFQELLHKIAIRDLDIEEIELKYDMSR